MKRRLILICFGALLLLATWIAVDLLSPSRRPIREFDPHEVARLETAMWRSYYERERLRLFSELVELLGKQYGMPFWRARLSAYHAARAAVVFQRGKQRTDYAKALPSLEKFYRAIERGSTESFDAGAAAALELEWWIVHRERAVYTPADLERALAALQAHIYRQPVESFGAHARFRAEAMLLRDARAKSGGLTEDDWRTIGDLLAKSWTALREAAQRSAEFDTLKVRRRPSGSSPAE